MKHLTTQEAVELGISISTMDILNRYITAEQDGERPRINIETYADCEARELKQDIGTVWLSFHTRECDLNMERAQALAEAYWTFRASIVQYLCWRDSELTLNALCDAHIRPLRFAS
jgi:hypothetical protein